MKTSQHILIACATSPVLTAFGAKLKALDLSITHAQSAEAARHIASHIPSLALVVIDEAGADGAGKALLQALKDHDRRLPVLWLGAEPRGAHLPPDAWAPHDVAVDTLVDHAQRLVLEDLYPASLVRTVVSACNSTFTVMFDSQVECGEPQLSRSALRPGDVSALMLVSGDDTRAHFILSADAHAFYELALRLGFDESDGPQQLAIDMASEITNQLVGNIKANSELLASIALTLPYVVTGTGLRIHSPTPKPSLAVQLTVDGAPLTFDFWWRTRAVPDPEVERFMAELASGDGLF